MLRWMGLWLDGWLEVGMFVYLDGWVHACFDGWMDECLLGQTDGWLYGWIGRIINLAKQAFIHPSIQHALMTGSLVRWMDERMQRCFDGWKAFAWMDGWMDRCVYTWTGGWMSVQIAERIKNGWMYRYISG